MSDNPIVRLTVKLDKETKDDLRVFAKKLGLNPSRLVRILILQCLRERRLMIWTRDPRDVMYKRYMEQFDEER